MNIVYGYRMDEVISSPFRVRVEYGVSAVVATLERGIGLLY